VVAWAGSAPSNTVLLVGGTEADVEDFDWPLRDGDLADLLERIASWQPRVIGVDIYRDHPKPPGSERLASVLARHKEIVWTFKLQDGAKRGDPAAGGPSGHGPRRPCRYRDRLGQCRAARLVVRR
jgi:adenylate cyclase